RRQRQMCIRDSPSIVRGLDYYVRTAWEVHHAQIGAKSALGGGGRYDGLSEMLGGPRVPGVGFGIGIERVALALEEEGVTIPADPSPILFLAPLDEAAQIEALALAEQLRPKIYVELGYAPKSPRKALEDALKKGAKYVAFLGEGERARGVVTLKHLESGEQTELEPLQLHSLFEGPDPK
ncbi:MAG: His/Gly/Thr/Pro-type tRNA ligase C-terminal domain-containing protein, partial [Meiothermus sp.]|nr:His/Gly/Thr/Pro-type tRNA ligase C-terminal domain-containing protein [Meiothermus sp.]